MNKRHISIIFFKQNQNSKLIKLAIFPLHFYNITFIIKTYTYLTKSKIFEIFIQTLSQAESEQWKKERVYRLWASAKAHKIKTCKNWTVEGLKKTKPNIFFWTLPNLDNKSDTKVKYGKQTESIAINEFKKIVWKKYIEMLISYWFCKTLDFASPDGIILSDANIVESILEIKCHISC